ncbi:hypothetical protein K2X89_07530 [Myxococcota bacterium]|nr:hypothetical protein [Myxococcota bacterium]
MTSAPDIPTDCEVGYGKPPLRTRFQSGRSGNPRGRPKGTNNLKTDLIEELGEKILVREGDQSRSVSKQRAFIKTLVSKTLKGDTRSASLLTTLMMRLLDTGEGAPEISVPLQDDEHAILEAFEQRVRRSGGGEDDPAAHFESESDSRSEAE